MRLGVFYTGNRKNVKNAIDRIRRVAENKGLTLIEYRGDEEEISNCDLAIAAGGDGTFLWTSSVVHKFNIPILGINLGSLGFLTDVREGEIEEVLEDIKAGNYKKQERTMLEGELKGEVIPVLNDVVVSQANSGMVELSIHINGKFVTDLSGDGLIISTPTGSTAYSLSSGGPILMPGTKGFVLTPICPHTLTFRPIVVDEDSKIKIKTKTESSVIWDGQLKKKMGKKDFVNIRKSDYPLRVIKIEGHDYFKILREKLNWGHV